MTKGKRGANQSDLNNIQHKQRRDPDRPTSLTFGCVSALKEESMAKRKNGKRRKAEISPRPRPRKATLAVVALTGALIVIGTLAQWRHLRVSPAVTPATSAVTSTTTPNSMAAANPVKEYIYAGGRLLATEELAATPVPTPTPCGLPANVNLLISEFRLRGPQGATDEFVELYNNSGAALTVCTPDGSSGWAVATADGVTKFVIPNGTIIPPRAHYLGANTSGGSDVAGYSLGGYAMPDNDFIGGAAPPPSPPGDLELSASLNFENGSDIADNTGLALFNTSNPDNWTLSNRLDAVGFTSTADELYREGTGLTPIAGMDGEHSFVRRATNTGAPQDTGNNAQDFLLISTDAGAYGRTGAVGDTVNGPSILGTPGPEGLTSPKPQLITASLVDPNVSSSLWPNRNRCGSCTSPNAAYGTMTIRRKFTNQTGQTITRLRFRVIDITTLNSPGYSPNGAQSDLRELDSVDTTVTLSDGTSVPVKGTVVEGSSQPLGGGLSTSLLVTLPASGLPAGESVNVQFVLGVQKEGSFRFAVLTEALP